MNALRGVAGALGAVVLTAVLAAAPAGAAGRVGPDQYFAGVVNGRDGNTATPIELQMACFGPIRPGETGHPMAGQTLAVHQLYPPVATTGSLGRTGRDSQIDAFFNAPPPASVPASVPASTTPAFVRYDRPKALPTSLVLPCSGTGTLWFVPVPVTPPSASAAVPIRYVGQP